MSVRCSWRVVVCACLVAFTWAAVRDGSAATNKGKELAPALVVTTTTTLNPKQGQKPASVNPMKSGDTLAVLDRQPEAVQKEAHQRLTKSKLPIAESHRRVKATKTKKVTTKAVLQPRTDLMYHGMLESPQRYDPRRNHLGVGILDPHNPELTHDHFQELDRNQDGSIDPVERAFGRLDMHLDISTHRRR